MGIYVFKTKFLMEQLRRDAAEAGSSRDFGKDTTQRVTLEVAAYPFLSGYDNVDEGKEFGCPDVAKLPPPLGDKQLLRHSRLLRTTPYEKYLPLSAARASKSCRSFEHT